MTCKFDVGVVGNCLNTCDKSNIKCCGCVSYAKFADAPHECVGSKTVATM